MRTGIDPKVDYAFKKLFGTEENKALLSAVLREEIADVELRSPLNEKDFADDKLTVLDVKVRLGDGRLVNVEMQMATDRFYPNRVIHYASEVYAGQLKEGNRYDVLRPTIGIHFVNDLIFRETSKYHLTFRLRCDEEPKLVFGDQLLIHVFQLPNFKLAAGDVAEGMERWCYFLKHGADMDRGDLPESLKTDSIDKALEVLEVINFDERERLLYQGRVRVQRDEASRKAEWEQIAREKAQLELEKAIWQKAVAKGRLIGFSSSVARGMKVKFGPRSLPFLPLLNRIEKEGVLIQLQDQLYTDISFEEFVAQIEAAK